MHVLREHGYEIHALGRTPLSGDIPATWHAVDLSTPGVIVPLMADVRPTHLLHLAWYTAPKAYWTAPENLQWVAISLELLRAFASHGGKRTVMAGSCAEYEWAYSDYSELDTPCRPSTLYGMCKHGLNTIARFYAAQAGLSYAWARIFFLYGPYENPARLVPAVTRALVSGARARSSPGTQARDFLYVEDAARALVQLVESDVQGPVNIGSGQAIPIRELASRIGDMLGLADRIDFGALPPPVGEPSVIRADNRRLVKEVGWHPRYDLDGGLGRTVEWWRHREQERSSEPSAS